MPRGTSRFGLRVSSAAVATMSNPMKAKKTIAAPAMTPPQPKVLGTMPNSVWISGASSPEPDSVGCAGGTKGV